MDLKMAQYREAQDVEEKEGSARLGKKQGRLWVPWKGAFRLHSLQSASWHIHLRIHHGESTRFPGNLKQR